MILSLPKFFPQTIFFLLAGFLLLSTGCYYPTSERTYVTEGQPPYAKVPTALVIVMQDESSEAEYQARRGEIINYLIERGYIADENDLVGDPASANRIIRAIVSGGGFTLSVFNQNAATGPLPDLETTDILYPADPYFIAGFYYFSEIGPRRLPPRPPGYRPHPRPPHEGPPPGHPMFDHDRHWSQSGQPYRKDDRHAPLPDRHPRGENHPQPDHSPAPAPDKKPPDRTQPHPDNHSTPPTAGSPPKPGDHSRPANNGQVPPPSTPSRSVDRPQPTDVDHRQRSNPPVTNRPPPIQPGPAPAPARSPDTDKKTPPVDNRDSRVQQN